MNSQERERIQVEMALAAPEVVGPVEDIPVGRVSQPRVVEPQRNQGVIRFEMPELTLPPTHPARVLWDVTGTLDLEKFLAKAKAIFGSRLVDAGDVMTNSFCESIWSTWCSDRSPSMSIPPTRSTGLDCTVRREW